MHGEDPDLAVHFTVIRAVGIPLYGALPNEIFGPVPVADYFNSIRQDVQSAQLDILEQPVSVVLNLRRVFAFQRQGLVCSKEQGGIWACTTRPDWCRPVVEGAVAAYGKGAPFTANASLLRCFAKKALMQIDAHGLPQDVDKSGG